MDKNTPTTRHATPAVSAVFIKPRLRIECVIDVDDRHHNMVFIYMSICKNTIICYNFCSVNISVITTTCNRKQLLKKTIESVQQSLFAPPGATWEHIIYDDGSIDKTKELFNNHSWRNIRYIRNEKNLGQSHGRNTAIRAARGTYIFPLDSDDIIIQRTLYNFLQEARQHPKTEWYISDFLRVDEHLSYRIGEDYSGWNFKRPEEVLDAIFAGEHFIQSNMFFTRELYLRAGGEDEMMNMAEDLDLSIRFLLSGAMPRYVPFISHLHRIHADTLSEGITLEKHKKDVEQLKQKYLSRLCLLQSNCV